MGAFLTSPHFGVALVATVLALPVILARCVFLAPTRLGWLFYYPNLVGDFLARRLRLPRAMGDLCLGGTAVAVAFVGSPWGLEVGLALALVIAVLEIHVRRTERKILTKSWAVQDNCWRPPVSGVSVELPLPPGAVPHPSWHPGLTLLLRGPFVSRFRRYDLGDLAPGRTVDLTMTIGNHSLVPAHVPVIVEVNSSGGILVDPSSQWIGPILKPGQVTCFEFRIKGERSEKSARVHLRVRCGSFSRSVDLHLRVSARDLPIEAAEITRYPGAARAAFAWRGDMDHYDTVTFQSIEGLKTTLGMAARYRMPQTMYLSSRLTLDPAETEKFYRHFGVDRGQAEVNEFIRWVRESVDLQHRASYPFESSKPYLMELGNHMHLHYGTDAAADEGNNWSRSAGIGAGEYAWQGGERDSFAEQRDNAMKARALFERHFGFTPKSWAMPDSTRDEHTPRAVEAAGCEVLSDSDARHIDNVVFQPPPHHPPGCRAIELTKRYPGDPEDYVHAAMIVYWLHRGHRRGIPVVFMCHQHMRQFAGHACTQFTEYVLRYVLTRFNGDLHINTVYAIGHYWEQVLCPEHKMAEVSVRAGIVTVTNKGSEALSQIPVDVRFQGGGKATYLVDLPPKGVIQIDSAGETHPVQVPG